MKTFILLLYFLSSIVPDANFIIKGALFKKPPFSRLDYFNIPLLKMGEDAKFESIFVPTEDDIYYIDFVVNDYKINFILSHPNINEITNLNFIIPKEYIKHGNNIFQFIFHNINFKEEYVVSNNFNKEININNLFEPLYNSDVYSIRYENNKFYYNFDKIEFINFEEIYYLDYPCFDFSKLSIKSNVFLENCIIDIYLNSFLLNETKLIKDNSIYYIKTKDLIYSNNTLSIVENNINSFTSSKIYFPLNIKNKTTIDLKIVLKGIGISNINFFFNSTIYLWPLMSYNGVGKYDIRISDDYSLCFDEKIKEVVIDD